MAQAYSIVRVDAIAVFQWARKTCVSYFEVSIEAYILTNTCTCTYFEAGYGSVYDVVGYKKTSLHYDT